MNRDSIICALIGLAGAVSNNGKTTETDRIVRDALLAEDSQAAVDTIHREKFTISPNCATCESPCGNTSDYDLEKYRNTPKELMEVKNEVVNGLVEIAEATRSDGDSVELPEVAYKAIAYLGYNLEETSYRKVLEELKYE